MGVIFRKQDAYWIDYYVGTKRVREKVGHSKMAAEEELKRRLAMVTLGLHQAPADCAATWPEMCLRYLDWARDHHRNAESEKYMLRRLDKWFGDIRLSRVTSWHIEQLKTALRKEDLSGPRVNRYLARLSKMFNLAMRWGLAEKNPVRGVEKYRESPGRLRYLSKDEIARLLLACGPGLRDVVTVAICTGCRRGELFRLTWRDVDLEHRLIFIRDSKTGKPREVPMSERALEVFTRLWRERSREAIFSSEKSMMRTAWDLARKRSGLTDIRFHDLRHTFASHLVMQGVGITTVQRLLGHTTLAMSLRYTHLSPQSIADSVVRIDSVMDGQPTRLLDTNWTPNASTNVVLA